jgi:hypothetical protein
MKKKFALLIIALSVMLIAGMSCTGASAPKLNIEKQELSRTQSGAAIVKVTIKNTGTVPAEFAEVRVTFYDGAKNVITNARDSVMNLGPGQSWDFQIPCLDARASQVKSYDLQVVSGSSSGRL